MKWKHFRVIGPLCGEFNGHNYAAGHLRRHRAHYELIVTWCSVSFVLYHSSLWIHVIYSAILFRVVSLSQGQSCGKAWTMCIILMGMLYTRYAGAWLYIITTQIASLMGPTWGPPGSCRPQVGPMLAPGTLLSGYISRRNEWWSCLCPLHWQPPWSFVVQWENILRSQGPNLGPMHIFPAHQCEEKRIEEIFYFIFLIILCSVRGNYG